MGQSGVRHRAGADKGSLPRCGGFDRR